MSILLCARAVTADGWTSKCALFLCSITILRGRSSFVQFLLHHACSSLVIWIEINFEREYRWWLNVFISNDVQIKRMFFTLSLHANSEFKKYSKIDQRKTKSNSPNITISQFDGILLAQFFFHFNCINHLDLDSFSNNSKRKISKNQNRNWDYQLIYRLRTVKFNCVL